MPPICANASTHRKCRLDALHVLLVGTECIDHIKSQGKKIEHVIIDDLALHMEASKLKHFLQSGCICCLCKVYEGKLAGRKITDVAQKYV